MLGFPTNKLDVDARAGQLAVTLRDTFVQVVTFKAWLDTQTDAQLIGLGYVQAEVNLLRAAYVDLTNLNNIAHAQGTQPAASDFFFNAKHLTGLV
jgi:hypothetical protein